ncbi:Predicted sugar epimerase [Serratia entomophila]|jgi:2-keto-myo-inositol isomerase|uniref:TIM barrel protein n=1 Tax=Serratia entomophila TaxID=42906 RepID=UPI001F3C42FE|nr:TIM barrel protein [Serratia entomophila]UIW18460.1 TIM barrel protein [Serratia entomophila]CAI0987400.1 Predicted sugar epimerase [Serratia entomophila]CAI0998826.1 Predicted sugar epimerase [Serratia entomophila]CAI1003691.1 Predicted sugar epimerase [Serratia entomophila]CAI1005664.1 Predicted sugar epimerase [Serratia entomophila]
MTIALDRFCINRKIAPNLDLDRFFRLVKQCGLSKVELRNDMPSGKVTDDLSDSQLNALAAEHGIEIVTINALGMFNLLDDAAALQQRAQALLSQAQAIHSKALVLCPHCSAGDARSEQQKRDDTLAALKLLAPLFQRYGVQGYVEPLGFGISSLRSSLLTQTLIRDAGAPYKIVLDTFHHYLSGVAQAEFDAQIQVAQIGLVHLSGVEDGRAKDSLSDEERIMLSERDRLESRRQVQNLERLGYTGIYAFEPFSSQLEGWSEADIEREIRQSIALLQG